MPQGDAEFDVFLSHNGRDHEVVERIAEQLRREGLRPFLDSWDLTPGGRWQQELANGLARSKTCALFVGPHAFGQWQLEELELALARPARDDGFRVFPVLLPGVEDPFDAQRLPPFLATRTWVDLRAGATSRGALQRLLNAIKGIAQGPATPTTPVGGVVPYRGLAPFLEEHAQFFFGRERETQRLVEILKGSPLVCVIGPSGSGKSSLVRAGLVPRLREGALTHVSDWQVCVLRPGARPLEALATQLAALGGGGSMRATLADLADDRRTLHHAVSLALGADSPDARVLVVVDQLEEIFTLCGDDREREAFVANLLHAAFAGGGRTVVVLTMRADFYARCAELPELAQRTARSLELVGPMDGDELREVIEEPARRVGLFFEPGLVETILDDAGGDGAALPLLEHALLEVWRRRVGDQLTLDGYVGAGRVEGALAQRAELVFAGFAGERQELARRLMLRLTQPGRGTEHTRRRATIAELRPRPRPAAFDEVLRELVDARLLTTSGGEEGGEPVVEVSHEALMRGWPRLRGWIEAAGQDLVVNRRLTDATVEWGRLGRDDGSLYRGARLAEAQALRERDPGALNEDELAFLDASVAREQAARRKELDDARELAAAQRRAKRRLVFVALVLLAGVVAAAGAGLEARQARDDAERERDRALSQRLAADSRDRLAANPELALLLAREAARRDHTPQAEAALRAALASPLVALRSSGVGGDVSILSVSGDGRVAATAGAGGDVALWDVGHARLIHRLSPGLGEPLTLALSRDGGLLLFAGERGIELWDVARGTRRGRLPARGLSPRSCRFTTVGGQVACVEDSEARIWAIAGGKLLAAPGLPRHIGLAAGEVPVGSAIADDGSVALASGRGSIQLYRRGRRVRSIAGRGLPLVSLALDAKGRRVLATSADGVVALHAASGRTIELPHGLRTNRARSHGTTAVGRVLLDPSGSVIVAFAAHPLFASVLRPKVWNLRTGRRSTLQTGADPVRGLEFAADGHLVVATTTSGAGVFDLASGDRLLDLPSFQRGFTVDAEAAGRSSVVSVSDTGEVAFWSPGITVLGDGPATVEGAAFSTDGRRVAADGGGTLRLWDAATGRPVGPRGVSIPAAAESAALVMAFSADGTRLRAALSDGAMHDLDLLRGGDARTPLDGAVTAISARGSFVALSLSRLEVRLPASRDAQLRIDGEASFSNRGGAFGAAVLDRDGRRLAVLLRDGTVQLWDVARRKRFATISLSSGIETLALRPDGRQLAIAGGGAVQIFDSSGRRRFELTRLGKDDGFLDLSYGPGGGLLSIDDEGRSDIYDIASRRRAATFAGRARVTIDPQGACVALTAFGRPPMLRRCDECGSWEQMRARADRRARRGLSPAERREFVGG